MSRVAGRLINGAAERRHSSQADWFSQSLVDSLDPIYFTNWADELDGDESEDVAVIVVYNVAVVSVEHVPAWLPIGVADSGHVEQ